jgi:hypothetical protein
MAWRWPAPGIGQGAPGPGLAGSLRAFPFAARYADRRLCHADLVAGTIAMTPRRPGDPEHGP